MRVSKKSIRESNTFLHLVWSLIVRREVNIYIHSHVHARTHARTTHAHIYIYTHVQYDWQWKKEAKFLLLTSSVLQNQLNYVQKAKETSKEGWRINLKRFSNKNKFCWEKRKKNYREWRNNRSRQWCSLSTNSNTKLNDWKRQAFNYYIRAYIYIA